MSAPEPPRTPIVDRSLRMAREWIRWFTELQAYLLTLTNDVTSVFGRVGDIVAAAGDYAASEVENDSTASGDYVDDALNDHESRLDTAEGDITTLEGRVAAAVADLDQVITDPPTQAEVQAISDKVDELLAAMRTAGLLAT